MLRRGALFVGGAEICVIGGERWVCIIEVDGNGVYRMYCLRVAVGLWHVGESCKLLMARCYHLCMLV